MNIPTSLPPLPLESGDHLTRDEFERRYDAMPELKKAELIEGVVYMPSPVRHTRHASPHAALITWLGHYWANTPGVQLGDNSSIRLDLGNEPQPDALLMVEPSSGGQAHLSADDYIVRMARNRVVPSTTRWYAFGASANGYVSTIVLTFPCATKSRAS